VQCSFQSCAVESIGERPIRVGRHIRFTRHMLEDWLAEQAKL
jgi:urease beta subunit